MSDNMHFTTEELSSYLSNFSTSGARESVVKELVASKLLKTFLDTPEGKLVLGATIDGIRQDMMKIVSLSVAGFDSNYEEIKHAALQINVAHDFMQGFVKQLERGEEHLKAMVSE